HRRREQQAHAAEELSRRVLPVPGRVLVDDVAEDQRVEQREDLVDRGQNERQDDERPVTAKVGVEESHGGGIIPRPATAPTYRGTPSPQQGPKGLQGPQGQSRTRKKT